MVQHGTLFSTSKSLNSKSPVPLQADYHSYSAASLPQQWLASEMFLQSRCEAAWWTMVDNSWPSKLLGEGLVFEDIDDQSFWLSVGIIENRAALSIRLQKGRRRHWRLLAATRLGSATARSMENPQHR